MESHELLKAVFRDKGPKQIAEDLGLSLSLIYKWAEATGERGTGTPNPLDRIQELLDSTGDQRIAEWVCECAGGYFVPNSDPSTSKAALLPASTRLIQEFAAMISLVSHAAGDGRISAAEAEDIRTRWEKIKSVTEGYVRDCERNRFESIREGE